MKKKKVVMTIGLNYCPNDSLGRQTPGFSYLSYPNRQNKDNFSVTYLFLEDKLPGDCWEPGQESCAPKGRGLLKRFSLLSKPAGYRFLLTHSSAAPVLNLTGFPSPGLNTPKPQTDLSSSPVWTKNTPNYKWGKKSLLPPSLSNKLAIKPSLLAISGRNPLFFMEKIKHISTIRYWYLANFSRNQLWQK